MEKKSKIFVAGGTGMVGSAIIRCLGNLGYENLVANYHLRKPSHDEARWTKLDLTNQEEVSGFFQHEKPEYVFLAAAKVGGVQANNTFPADFIHINLAIQQNVIHASFQNRVNRLLFLGSSCIYPKLAAQPMKEEYLLTGVLEPTNEAYAIAKIAGIKMCEAYNRQHGTRFLAVMPTNLYGPEDNFDLETSHVLPALIRKFHEAKVSNAATVTIWGTGSPRREFLHVDDMANACVFVMNLGDETVKNHLTAYPSPCFVNVGVGSDLPIQELAQIIKGIVGFQGTLNFDASMPDGTPRKLLDVSRLTRLGWTAGISLEEGIARTYGWYQKAGMGDE
ncbi:MAG: GDP-L-fucose synthase [Proteobacteria bacterium]|nr:GDP-L-fucose synthase [Pseudomonadota bacterium]MBU4469871.1 GDP-L-fucose synthase [Pseudomonadota bacterium]MCG2751557.1 GDP-L-fucose synthase [Desulfobacteraceae bacterium]